MKLHSVKEIHLNELGSEISKYEHQLLGWEFCQFIPHRNSDMGQLVMVRRLCIDEPADKALILKMREGQ